MKKKIIFVLSMLALPFSLISASDTIKSNNPLIEYTGRIDFSNPLAPKFSYSSVSIRACFQGTSIAILLNDDDVSNFYNIIVDNEIVKRLQVSKGLTTYPIASNLTDTVHEIEIFRLTELIFGKTTFNGFLVDNGKSLVAITTQRTHLIEYVGNSITCGYGNEGVNGGTFGATTENHYLTYAAITSRNFNARHLAVCRSGIGIYRNYGEAATGSADCMTNNYSRIFLYDKSPKYNFQLKPDLICVDLGTNDFSTSNGDSARYVSKYFSFIDTLQYRNNGTDILLLLGPMMGDPDLSKVRRYLNFIVDSANKKDKGKLYFFEMSQQTGDLGIGIDYHPTVAQHIKNSLELTKFISGLKGWKVKPSVVKADIPRTNEVKVYFNVNIADSLKSYEGFKIIIGTESVAFEKIYVDSNDNSIVHFILDGNISVGQNVTLSYVPGSVISSDSLKLGAISDFKVSNKLTETKVAKIYVDKSGTSISFSFNKTITEPTDINSITIFDNKNNVLQIDSVKNIFKGIQIFVKTVVSKGDTIFVTMPTIIYGQDGVPVTPIKDYIVLNNSTSVESVKKKGTEGIEIFPNPVSNNKVNYNIPEAVRGNAIAELFDMQGKLVFQQNLLNSKGILDFNNITKSQSYILKISTINKMYQKIILL